jgi:ribonuclease-3
MTPTFLSHLGHTFKSEHLLRDALTHPSASRKPEAARAYERLEFLGDRVLGLVMADWLLALNPTEAEGSLARRHATLVKRDALLAVAEAIGLEEVLKHSADAVTDIRGRATVLADGVEAIIGALFLDGGLSAAGSFIRTHFAILMANGDTAVRDPKTALQEWAQARGLGTPIYSTVTQSGPAHAPEFVISVTVGSAPVVTAKGKSKQDAEKTAAADLLARLVQP